MPIGLSDLELLQIEIETIWTPDEGGRVRGPELVVASSAAGVGAALGPDVPDDLAATLLELVASAMPSQHLSQPPAVVEQCRQLLEDELGPVQLTPHSGPSFVISEPLVFASDARLVRSDAPDVEALRRANPGNWGLDEWQHLLDGQLGPWAMALRNAEIVSICHTPRLTERSAEAGTWTHPDHRGQGHAAATTAAWASLLLPTGRCLFYSTSRSNVSSQRVAARLALRPIGWLWQLARTSGPAPRCL